MLKSSKRAADSSGSKGEPVKRKAAKFERKQVVKSPNKNGPKAAGKFAGSKFGKSINGKPSTKLGDKSNAGKFTKKFGDKKPGGHAGPAAGKFTKKFGDKKPGDHAGQAPGKFTKKFGDKKPGDNAAQATAEPTEKTDWRKFKQDKKELKLKRKKAKDSYEISIEAKQIYEKLKCRRTEQKQALVEKLYNLLSAGDVIRKLIMAHDTARIIQCMLKHASPGLRDQLSEKLLPLAVEMAVSKYSHFCVLRMFKYGSPTTKSKLVDSFLGNIVRLAGHNISSKILDHVYLSVASAKQRSYMRQEFYGELYRKAKDDSVKQLTDAYKDTPAMKASILGAVKSSLEHVANKQLVDSSLVHAVMLEYLHEIDEDKMEETVSMFAPLIPLMLTTKDGCQAAIICFYKASTKNRRAIIKTIKEHLVKICTHEHGHIFIMALLNSLDDTKATKKAIYDSIQPALDTLMASQWGRRVVEWLVSPADTNCFHPTFIASIEEGLQYGKKDKDVRRKEIFEQIEESLAAAIAEKPNFWLSNRHIGLVTAEILKKVSAPNFVKTAAALAQIIAEPAWSVIVEEESKEKNTKAKHDVEKIITDHTKMQKQKRKAAKGEEDEGESTADEAANEPVEVSGASIAGIEDPGLHIVLKKIIKNDKERLNADATAQTFGSMVVEQLTDETLKYWLTVNRACFILLNIVEQNNQTTKTALKQLLKPLLSTLKQQKASGAQLLLKKLEF